MWGTALSVGDRAMKETDKTLPSGSLWSSGEGRGNTQKRKVSGLLARTSAMEKPQGREADGEDCGEGCRQFKVTEGLPENAAHEQELTKDTGAQREAGICLRFASHSLTVGRLCQVRRHESG